MLFKNKKVTIMGLGLLEGGKGTAKFFCQQGAKVLVTDLKTKEQLKESIQKLKDFTIEYVLGRHRVKDFIDADLIIKNPAVPNNSPYLKFAKQHNIPIESDISIFFKLSKAPIIGITGTKGKSTVATLIYLLLKSKYPKAVLAGNIGVSPLEVLPKIKKGSRVVLELSSFELENLRTSPKIAVITNIFPDHLERHKNFREYIEAKKTIFKYQKKRDILVLNYDNLETRKFSSSAPSQVYFYSIKTMSRKEKVCFLRKDEVFFCKEKESIFDIKNLNLYGEHNISNILAAILVAKLFKIPSKNIKKVLPRFKGVDSRQELIRELRGVKYFNDTTATIPEATMVAIKTFNQRFPNSKIILIAGGQDKNLNYKSLAREIKKKINCLILLPGTASNKIKKELRILKSPVQISLVNSMEKAVEKAIKKAKGKDIVLLSPGAASFNLFKNEFDRGEQFKEAVRKLSA